MQNEYIVVEGVLQQKMLKLTENIVGLQSQYNKDVQSLKTRIKLYKTESQKLREAVADAATSVNYYKQKGRNFLFSTAQF